MQINKKKDNANDSDKDNARSRNKSKNNEKKRKKSRNKEKDKDHAKDKDSMNIGREIEINNTKIIEKEIRTGNDNGKEYDNNSDKSMEAMTINKNCIRWMNRKISVVTAIKRRKKKIVIDPVRRSIKNRKTKRGKKTKENPEIDNRNTKRKTRKSIKKIDQDPSNEIVKDNKDKGQEISQITEKIDTLGKNNTKDEPERVLTMIAAFNVHMNNI